MNITQWSEISSIVSCVISIIGLCIGCESLIKIKKISSKIITKENNDNVNNGNNNQNNVAKNLIFSSAKQGNSKK